MSTYQYVLPVFGKKNKIMKVMCSLNESYLAKLYYITVSMQAIQYHNLHHTTHIQYSVQLNTFYWDIR